MTVVKFQNRIDRSLWAELLVPHFLIRRSVIFPLHIVVLEFATLWMCDKNESDSTGLSVVASEYFGLAYSKVYCGLGADIA